MMMFVLMNYMNSNDVFVIMLGYNWTGYEGLLICVGVVRMMVIQNK